MAVQKITETQVATTIAPSAHLLITQDEQVGDQTVHSLRRLPKDLLRSLIQIANIEDTNREGGVKQVNVPTRFTDYPDWLGKDSPDYASYDADQQYYESRSGTIITGLDVYNDVNDPASKHSYELYAKKYENDGKACSILHFSYDPGLFLYFCSEYMPEYYEDLLRELEYNGSLSLGYRCDAKGICSVAQGKETKTGRGESHAEGLKTEALAAQGHAEGMNTKVYCRQGHAEGYGSQAGSYSDYEADGSDLYGTNSSTIACHAEGKETQATAPAAHAEGANTTASGAAAHAEGKSTTASGTHSHAEGGATIASGTQSHAEGYNTEASGQFAHVEGRDNLAKGAASHVGGKNSVANGTLQFLHGEGISLSANEANAAAFGKYNAVNFAFGDSGTLFSVGIGSSNAVRETGFAVNRLGAIFSKIGLLISDVFKIRYTANETVMEATKPIRIRPNNAGSGFVLKASSSEYGLFPEAASMANLGSSTNPFNTLYLSNGIYIGGTQYLLVPVPTAADTGKKLTAGSDGTVYWN